MKWPKLLPPGYKPSMGYPRKRANSHTEVRLLDLNLSDCTRASKSAEIGR